MRRSEDILENRPELSKTAKEGVRGVMGRMSKVDRVISNAKHPNEAIVIGNNEAGEKEVVAVRQTGLKKTDSLTYRPDELSPGTRAMWVDED
jgi:hypothetical protein